MIGERSVLSLAKNTHATTECTSEPLLLLDSFPAMKEFGIWGKTEIQADYCNSRYSVAGVMIDAAQNIIGLQRSLGIGGWERAKFQKGFWEELMPHLGRNSPGILERDS